VPRTACPARSPAKAVQRAAFLVAAVYDSKEDCERFAQETLMPSMALEGGPDGPPRGARLRDRELQRLL